MDEVQREIAEFYAAAWDDCLRVVMVSVGNRALVHSSSPLGPSRRMHERTAAGGIGDAHGHERQAALHRAAAAADWQRAERVQSLLSDHEQVGLAPVSDEPRDGLAG